MIESEFRDWMRGQLRSLDERIKRLDRETKEPRPREPIDASLRGHIADLIAAVAMKAKEGEVAGLAVAFVDGEGVTKAGWAAEGGYFSLAGATTFLGLEILEDYRKSEAVNAPEAAGDGESDP